jgi:hypothetical protein
MKRKQILITGGDISNLKTIEKQVTDIDMATTIAETTEAAIEKFHQYYFDVVIFSNEINADDERKLRKIFTVQNPELIIIQYEENDGEFLNKKLDEAIRKQNKNERPFISFVDDALKNAGLNIIVQ